LPHSKHAGGGGNVQQAKAAVMQRIEKLGAGIDEIQRTLLPLVVDGNPSRRPAKQKAKRKRKKEEKNPPK
jgi:hypothetical protein